MARLLYRLGRFSARHAVQVLVAWLVALVAAVGAFLLAGGTLATAFNVPGTETAKVDDRLTEQLPSLAGVSGTVVFATIDGQAFTDAQQQQIGALMTKVATVDHVAATVDPFTAQGRLEEQTAQVAQGRAELVKGQAELEAGQKQIDDATAKLDAGQAELDAAVAQAKAAGMYDRAKTQFDAQQKQIDDARATLETQQAQVTVGKAQLAQQEPQLEAATELMDAAAGIRTVSADGATALGTVMFDEDLFDLSQESKDAVVDILDSADIPGVRIDWSSEIATSTAGLIGPGEVIGVIIAAVVLIVMLGSLIAAGLPLLSSLIGVGVGVAGSMAFSGIVSMSNVTPVLGLMLGLAVGIDYSLFILNRHRRQLRAGMDLEESVGLANGTSGNAVVFAGATVVVALLALNATGIPFLGVMGDVGAACVAIAVLVAVTLTPALLHLIGPRVLSRKARAAVGHQAHETRPVKPMKTSRAVATIVGAVVVLGAIAAPVTSMRLGLPDGSGEPTDSTQYRAYTTIAKEFGAGANGPLVVTATLPAPVDADAVTGVEASIATTLMGVDGVKAVAPVGVGPNEDFIAFQVIPADGPSSESTENLVHALREASPIEGDITLGVASQTSGNIDISAKLAGVLPVYLALVVGLSLIIMIVVFRSLLVPIVAAAGFVLSLFAALGGVVAIYQWGWLSAIFGVHDPGPVLNFLPTIVVGVLFGLAMDYQLFLVSGMREAYVHGAPARQAVAAGLRGGASVVTAAAIIMASVFGGFVFSHLALVRPLGFALAFGVLLDAFVVRMNLIPAVMHLLGGSAWWLPRRLERILPDVDIEGAALERSLHPAAAPLGTGEAQAGAGEATSDGNGEAESGSGR